MAKDYAKQLAKLSQALAKEAFESGNQDTAAVLYDASHLIDMAMQKLKQLS